MLHRTPSGKPPNNVTQQWTWQGQWWRFMSVCWWEHDASENLRTKNGVGSTVVNSLLMSKILLRKNINARFMFLNHRPPLKVSHKELVIYKTRGAGSQWGTLASSLLPIPKLSATRAGYVGRNQHGENVFFLNVKRPMQKVVKFTSILASPQQ